MIVFRIPNYNNIYRYMLNKKFLNYDFRLSHNFYFSEKSCDFMFKRARLKIHKKVGLQEYPIDHLIAYIKTGKRVKKFSKKFTNKISNEISRNLEESMSSTSFLYFVKK